MTVGQMDLDRSKFFVLESFSFKFNESTSSNLTLTQVTKMLDGHFAYNAGKNYKNVEVM